MLATNIPTSLTAMALVATFVLLAGALLLFKRREFAIKAILTGGLFVLALKSRNPELSELLATTMWPMVVAIAAILTTFVIYDISRMAVKLDRRATRRCHRGSRRTTPARH